MPQSGAICFGLLDVVSLGPTSLPPSASAAESFDGPLPVAVVSIFVAAKAAVIPDDVDSFGFFDGFSFSISEPTSLAATAAAALLTSVVFSRPISPLVKSKFIMAAVPVTDSTQTSSLQRKTTY